MLKHAVNPNKWIDLYADYLFNYTISRVNDDETAKDLVQDTFLAALKAVKNFKGDATERTWLISILKRKIIDYYRKINSKKHKAEVRIQRNNTDDDQRDWLETSVADPFDRTPEDDLQNEELRNAIHECLRKLPKRQADIFKKKTILNIETEVICNELKITASNLWVIIHRARTAMASCLKENWL